MKNRPWKNAQTAIELTSLLDVIFIVLMIVVCNQQVSTAAKTQAAEQAASEAEYALAEAELREQNAEALQEEAQTALENARVKQAEADNLQAERDFYAEQLDTLTDLQSQVLPVTVYVEYAPADLKNRTIRVLAGNTELDPVSVTPETSAAAFAKLKGTLIGLLQENSGIPVILAVNKSRILYRDEKTVTALLEELQESFPNLYLKAGGEASS